MLTTIIVILLFIILKSLLDNNEIGFNKSLKQSKKNNSLQSKKVSYKHKKRDLDAVLGTLIDEDANNSNYVYDNEIKRIMQKRNIRYLIHFTNIKNIESIFKYGICDIETLNKINVKYHYNDKDRFDRKLNCVCLSIEYPNNSMFYKYRQNTNNKYCIIVLDAKKVLLDTKNIKYFSPKNAASTESKNLSDKISASAFENMYSSFGNENKYRENLKRNMTTNLQAEIQFEGIIPPEYIVGIECEDKKTTEELISYIKNKELLKNIVNKLRVNDYYFKSRKVICDNNILNNPQEYYMLDKLSEQCDNSNIKSVRKKLNYNDYYNLIKEDSENIKLVPLNILTREMCEFAVKSDGINIKYIPQELITEDLAIDAISSNVKAFKYIPKNTITANICFLVAKLDGRYIKYIPNEFITGDLCYLATEKNPKYIKYIPIYFTNKKEEMTKLCSKLVDLSGKNLKYIPQDFITEEMCLKAVCEAAYYAEYIPLEIFNEKFCYKILNISGYLLNYIPEQFITNEIREFASNKIDIEEQFSVDPSEEADNIEISLANMNDDWRDL